MKIGVTAASGQLGGAIIEALKKEIGNENVIGLARTPEKAAHLGVEIRKGDYDSQQDFENGLKDVQAVLLVSGMAAPEKRIEQHRNVIEGAKKAGVQKIVYTSVQGPEKDAAFAPIVNSNRQTEADIQSSGLDWSIGRNGIYIEPDVEYIETYKNEGKVANCAGQGRCNYTTRTELAYAYAQMLTKPEHNGQTYLLNGEALTQTQLTRLLNAAFGTHLVYETMTIAAYEAERKAALGDFLGTVISGIYKGIQMGAFDQGSDYEKAAGRPHISWETYFEALK